jgi:hypothetical protein
MWREAFANAALTGEPSGSDEFVIQLRREACDPAMCCPLARARVQQV